MITKSRNDHLCAFSPSGVFVFLFQQKGLDPLLKHHILDFIIIVFKHDAGIIELDPCPISCNPLKIK